jgi:hypothetical protein
MFDFIFNYAAYRFLFYFVTVMFIFMIGVSISNAESKDYAKFDKDGNLIQPENYEWRTWMYIGTPITPNSLNPPEAPFPEFHNVYIDPVSFEHFSKTGEFPDGTLLIKELVSVGATKAASGNGYFQGDFIGLEAAYKDSKRYPNEPGNWAYFTFSHEAPPYPNVATLQPAAACNSCHEANAADDWVFTQYYPVIRAVKPKK